jgi:hypothetical protein
MLRKVVLIVIGLSLFAALFGLSAQSNQSALDQVQKRMGEARPPGVGSSDWIPIASNVGIALKNAKKLVPKGKIVGTVMVKTYSDGAWHELIIDNSTGHRGAEPVNTGF